MIHNPLLLLISLAVIALADTTGVIPDSIKMDSGIISPKNSTTIRTIIIHGNKRTKEFVIRYYLPFDTGSTFDSTLLATAKYRLNRTGLFSEVNIFALKKTDGIDIHVLVAEMFFIPIDNAGLTYYSRRYGQDYGWLKFSFGLTDFNFGGRAETFSVWGQLWENRGLGISWSKPLLPSPYSLTVGISAGEGPDLLSSHRIFSSNGTIAITRRLLENSRISLNISPVFSIIDTVDAPATQHKFYETFIGLSWSTDYRDQGFAPTRGWSISCITKTNYLLSADSTIDAIPLKTPLYAQFGLDARLYHQGILKDHVVAYWLKTVVRNADGGSFRVLSAGGDGSLRGYRSGELGSRVAANDYITASIEYRHTIWTAPTMEFPWFNNLPSPVRELAQDATKGFFYRFDGAWIADGALLWNDVGDILHPLTMEQEHGLGLGCGIRLLYPNLRRSLSLDIVYPVYVQNYPRTTISTAKGPLVHAYIDMHF